MNKKINLVFSDDKLANGRDRNEFNRSCIGKLDESLEMKFHIQLIIK